MLTTQMCRVLEMVWEYTHTHSLSSNYQWKGIARKLNKLDQGASCLPSSKYKSSQQTNYSGHLIHIKLLIHFLLCLNHFQTLRFLLLKSNCATAHMNSKIYPLSNCLNLISNPLNSLIQGSLNCCKYLWGGLCCLIATKGIIMLCVCAYIL